MAQRCCLHRHRWHHGPHKAANLGWLRYWKAQTRHQMNRLYRDAHTHGKGGWRKDGRGWRYQILAGAYTGHMCVTPLKVSGNRVTGGKPSERVLAAAKASARLSASGQRHSFYSQTGAWDISHGITGEPWGHRSDCSSWFTAMYWSAGLPDPNRNGYQGGYTGTLVAHGTPISRERARHTPGAAVLFGPPPCHHVEMAVGDGSENTIGHGSAPVDYGTFDLLNDEKHFRAYLP
jgi:hypothetical protein